jgi:hypothetical protein
VWAQVPGTGPPARWGHGLAYDLARGEVLLVGGAGDAGPLADTWRFDGTQWEEVAVEEAPRAVAGGLAYDVRRARTVLIGGRDDSDLPLDTVWEFDGTAWALAPPAPLGPRSELVVTFDPVAGAVVAIGGRGLEPAPLGDIWLYDGTTWRLGTPTFDAAQDDAPAPRHAAVGGYDVRRRRLLLALGSSEAAIALDDIWSLNFEAVGATEVCGERGQLDADLDGAAGCDDEDCWGTCTPLCGPPGLIAECPPDLPTCGDASCDVGESCATCPGDCPVGDLACPIRCGDAACDDGFEDVLSCPGDCVP